MPCRMAGTPPVRLNSAQRLPPPRLVALLREFDVPLLATALLVAMALGCGGDDATTLTQGPDDTGASSSVATAQDFRGYAGERTDLDPACLAATPPLTLQAEEARLRGVRAAMAEPGYRGSGYVTDFDQAGDAVSFDFCVPEADYYTFELRFANGSGQTASRSLLLDGQAVPGDHRFRARWSWRDWEPATETDAFRESVPLQAGRHQLSVSYSPADRGELALDELVVMRGPAPSATTITAMLLNDWDQLVAGAFASRVIPADDTSSPPRLGELRWRGNWKANLIDDASGYLDEAERYWRWMASVQERGENEEFPEGTWWTNYSYWTENEGIPFVQPEWDSLGLFTIGVYRHHLALLDSGRSTEADEFFQAMRPAVERAADFISDHLEDNGFGPAEFSIWEDTRQYAMFTQVTYASGLLAAAQLFDAAAGGERSESWLEAARSIRDAILRPYSEQDCSGLWDPEQRYFNRGVDPDCKVDSRVDASTDLIWVFGLLDVEDRKARQHRDQVLSRLSPTDYYQGISTRRSKMVRARSRASLATSSRGRAPGASRTPA